jgi:hypothetical protein
MDPNTTDPMAGYTASSSPTQFAIDGTAPASTPAQTAMPKGPGGIAGFLADNASTIGSIVGGLGGELIDPFGGAVGGSALGGGLGQEIENVVTGSKGDVLNAALTGGASELGGQLIGKGVQAAGGLLKSAAPNVFKSAFNLSPKLNTLWKAADTSKAMLDYGIGGSLKGMVDTSGKALDSIGNIYDQAVGTIGDKIDTKSARDAVDNYFRQPDVIHLSDADKTKITDTLEGSVDKNGNVGGGLLKNENGMHTLDPHDAVDNMRTLQSVGHAMLRKGSNPLSPDFRLQQMGEAYLSAGNAIQNTLDDATSKVSIDSLKTPENLAPLAEISPNLANAVKAAKTPQEIRMLMEPFLNLRRMAGVTIDSPRKMQLLSTLIGGAAGFGVGGPGGAALGAVVGTPLLEGVEQSIAPPLVTKSADIINKVGTKLAGSAAKTSGITGRDVVTKSLTQLIGHNIAGAPAAGGQTSTGPLTAMVNNQVSQVAQTAHAAVNPPIPDFNQLVQQIGLRGAEDYMAYVKQTQPEITQEQQTQILDTTKALQGVQALAAQYEKIAGTGAGVGQLAQLGTNIPGIQNLGSEASLKAYDDNINDLAATIASVLGSGRSSAAMLDELKSELPAVTDSPQTAQIKLSMVINRLNQALQGTLAAPATNVPGQLANFSGQSVPGLSDTTNLIMPPGMSFANQ